MNRKIEIIITLIGMIFNLTGGVAFGVLAALSQTDFFKIDDTVTAEDIFILHLITNIGWFITILFGISFIAGIIATYLYRGNKCPRAASILLIIIAIILAIGTLFVAIMPAIIYVAAGIVGLLRKTPPVDPEIAVTDLEKEV